MSVAAKTMFIFGVYLGLFGLSMIFTPNLVASLFDVTFELWMARVIGVIQICIAIHYFIAVYEENMSLFYSDGACEADSVPVLHHSCRA
ncbi:hypothetical protein Q8W71_31875 [Methylobacterium sp. NEAU 140]|uniref:hypothetical protein n=1 Tax=Methylobacterium sp. NEAU 140 TaxID=3064945 RepID=UPI002734636A|nr:hypothetical protein [Methylobacterium sp. NEAU 140]MDP4027178.1 hypothetical protein [Methylobacterium sp. NEAU 140]